MKKLFLLLAVSVSLFSCGSKSNTTSTKSDSTIVETVQSELSIEHQYDEIQGKDYYGISKPLSAIDGNKGFTVSVFFKKSKDKIEYNGLAINARRLGGCFEDATLYVLFQDGTKLQLKQWNDFDCEGDVFLDFKRNQLTKLNKPIKGIKLINGFNFDSYEKTLTDKEDINYFTNVLDAINNQKVVEVKQLTGY